MTNATAPPRLAGGPLFGRAVHPVTCGLGPLVIGAGQVFPEVNFTLPPMEVTPATWGEVLAIYDRLTTSIIERAVALSVPGLVIEFEHLPPMTQQPEWGEEVAALMKMRMTEGHAATGMPMALRVTPVDLRETQRPPRPRTGEEWPLVAESMRRAASAGADILSIESVGGKEVHDAALVEADLAGMIAGAVVLGCADMEFIWQEFSRIARAAGVIPGGDTACGFANTAMVLADRGMIPVVLACVARSLGAVRCATACENGAVGPGKDCAYENVYLKEWFGTPASMEGSAAACAHLSHLGNVAAACADLWSNESVQDVRLLAGDAPVVFTEILAYQCRLMNEALARGEEQRLAEWLTAPDARLNAQAYLLAPSMAPSFVAAVLGACAPYARAIAAVHWTLDTLRAAHDTGALEFAPRELPWIDMLSQQLDTLPPTAEELVAQVADARPEIFIPSEYGF